MNDFEERKQEEVERLKTMLKKKVSLGDLVGASMTLAQLKLVSCATEPVGDGRTFILNGPNTQHSQKT